VTIPALAQLIERATGLAIDRGGVSGALDRFVTERLRVLRISRIEDYVTLAADPTSPEQRRLIDAITVPHTWFFRDTEQLHTIATLITAAPSGPVAIWVAGCATGEEAYTLAMIGHRVGREVSVLATDVNETALAAARRGVYGPPAVRDVPVRERRWLLERDGSFSVDPTLRGQVTFARHNLVDSPPAPPHGAWDLVVCRNVLIYFAPRAAARLLQRFARSVREGGALVVGASEVVFEPPAGLELVTTGNRLVLRRTERPAIAKPTLPRASTAPLWRSPATVSSPASASARASPSPAPEPAARDDDLVAKLARGHRLFEHGEIARAVAVYGELARSHPSVAEVWLFLGIARYAHGEVDAAAHALRASLCLDPALWPAGFYLARAYERLGRRAEAMQQYDLVAVDELQPLALQSDSAVINELRAFRHDFRHAARRLTTEPLRRLLK
jgi:chemotaxis protein methyltransferase CheR